MKNQLKLLAIITLAMLSVKSYSQSGNSIVITPAITAQSNTFKSLVGQTRITEFKALQALIVTKASQASCSTPTSINFTIKSEVISLFGTPNMVLSPNLIAYNLSSTNQTCQAVFGVDNNGIILFIQINNCP